MFNVYLTCTTKLRKCIINISSINVTVRSLWHVALNKLILPYFWIANHFINRTVNIHNISYHCSIFKNLMWSKKIHNTQKLNSSIWVCRRQHRHKANLQSSPIQSTFAMCTAHCYWQHPNASQNYRRLTKRRDPSYHESTLRKNSSVSLLLNFRTI